MIKSFADFCIIMFFICFVLYVIGIFVSMPMCMIAGITMGLFAMGVIISSGKRV